VSTSDPPQRNQSTVGQPTGLARLLFQSFRVLLHSHLTASQLGGVPWNEHAKPSGLSFVSFRSHWALSQVDSHGPRKERGTHQIIGIGFGSLTERGRSVATVRRQIEKGTSRARPSMHLDHIRREIERMRLKSTGNAGISKSFNRRAFRRPQPKRSWERDARSDRQASAERNRLKKEQGPVKGKALGGSSMVTEPSQMVRRGSRTTPPWVKALAEVSTQGDARRFVLPPTSSNHRGDRSGMRKRPWVIESSF